MRAVDIHVRLGLVHAAHGGRVRAKAGLTRVEVRRRTPGLLTAWANGWRSAETEDAIQATVVLQVFDWKRVKTKAQ